MSDKVIYQFLDTNVLIYVHDKSAGQKHERANELLETLWQDKTGCLSIQVFQEFYVNVTRKLPLPLTSSEASQIISKLGTWRIHTPSVADILSAIQIQQRYQISFWDALIIRSAAVLGCAIVWSEDLNPGQVYTTVRVENPFAS